MTQPVGSPVTPATVGGTMAKQDADSVLITGGVINGVTLGGPYVTLNQYSVSSLPANAPVARVNYVTDGDSGSPCLAVGDGSTWRRIPLGATCAT